MFGYAVPGTSASAAAKVGAVPGRRARGAVKIVAAKAATAGPPAARRWRRMRRCTSSVVPPAGDHAHTEPDAGAIAQDRAPRDWPVSVWRVPNRSARVVMASGPGGRLTP